METEEFSNYHDYFIVDYAIEIAANYGHWLEKSRNIALKELLEDLPQAISTPDNFLFCIEESGGKTIGSNLEKQS